MKRSLPASLSCVVSSCAYILVSFCVRLSLLLLSRYDTANEYTTITQECCKQYWTCPGRKTPQNSNCTATYNLSQKLSKLDELDMRDAAWTNLKVVYSCGPLHMDEKRQDDQLEPIYNSSVSIQDVSLKTYRVRWTIETDGGRGSSRSVLAARHDDYDNWLVWKCILNNLGKKRFLKSFWIWILQKFLSKLNIGDCGSQKNI